MKFKTWVSAIVFLLAAFDVVSSPAQPLSDRSRGPIRVGVLEAITGPVAMTAAAARAGREAALEEAGFIVGGRKLELIIEDYAFRPEVAVTKAQKLLEQDKVQILLGPMSSAAALAIRDHVVSKGVPWILTVANTSSLTRERGAPNLFRPSYSAEQYQYPAGAYVREKLGYRRIAVVGLDYVSGRDEAGAFIEGFKSAGGQGIQEIWMPLGTPDPAPFIAKINPDAAEALVIAGVWGSDAVRFIRSLSDYGMRGRLPILSTYGAVEDGVMLPALGKAGVGIRNYGPYANGLDAPETKRFVQTLLKKTGQPGNLGAYFGYVQGRAIVDALKATAGDIDDTRRFLAALSRVEFAGPAGTFKFDKHRNAMINIYLQEVREADGEVRNGFLGVIGRDVPQR